LREDAEQHLESVMSWCRRARMQPFVKLGKKLNRHMDGILGYFNNFSKRSAEHLSHFSQISGGHGIYATRLSMV
jgi:hypothetical protein